MEVADPDGGETASAGDCQDTADDRERRGNDGNANDTLGGDGDGNGGPSGSNSDEGTVHGGEDPPAPSDPEDPDGVDDDDMEGNNRKVCPLSSIKATDWLAWKRHFQATYRITNWENECKKNEVLAAMDREAYTATVAISPDGKMFDQMLTASEGCFITQAGSELAESEFNAARQLPDKTILMFHTRMRDMHVHGFFSLGGRGGGPPEGVRV
jgi:hypothetical protein